MFEVREAKYAWGQPVHALIDMFNDGSHPNFDQDALMVAVGQPGEIVQIGHHSEANMPVYIVEFEGGVVIGCLEEEIAPRDLLQAAPLALSAGA